MWPMQSFYAAVTGKLEDDIRHFAMARDTTFNRAGGLNTTITLLPGVQSKPVGSPTGETVKSFAYPNLRHLVTPSFHSLA